MLTLTVKFNKPTIQPTSQPNEIVLTQASPPKQIVEWKMEPEWGRGMIHKVDYIPNTLMNNVNEDSVSLLGDGKRIEIMQNMCNVWISFTT